MGTRVGTREEGERVEGARVGVREGEEVEGVDVVGGGEGAAVGSTRRKHI